MSRPALSADRALEVIDLLTRRPSERFTLSELVRDTGVNGASLHALLAVLERRGYVQRHPVHRTYGLGPALVAAGTVALDQLAGIREARQELDALSASLDLEVVLTAPAGAEIVVVGRAGHDSAFGESLRVGRRLPLAGTVFLAWSTDDEIEQWLARARPALSAEEVDAQRRSIASVRARGYAVALESAARRAFGSAVTGAGRTSADETATLLHADAAGLDELLAQLAHGRYQLDTLDEGSTYEVAMVAAPIFDAQGRVVAAIAASGFPPAISAGDLRRVADEVRGRATIITKRTHGRVPDEGGTRS
ncbi:MAG: helix-turn-helix domain-containing protein [Acidimicrobiales bacterium]|nr:helix-turn-helix domain-containing protein [Acidimicrobiales bacterium]